MEANPRERHEKLPPFLLDRNAAWRALPVFPKQSALLDKLGLAHTQDMTAGQASDLIGEAITNLKRRSSAVKEEQS